MLTLAPQAGSYKGLQEPAKASPRLEAERGPKDTPRETKSPPSISTRPNKRWALCTLLGFSRKPQSKAFQISVAYSRMVRSEENQPMRAVLSTAERHHSLESCQRYSTHTWAFQ